MKKRVLLADDDFAVLAGLAGVLVSEGYEVIHAADGEEVLEKFRVEEKFDIVLLDLNMPKKNGWDTFEQISARYPLLPVIVITARPDEYAHAVAAGVGALMEKPLDLPVLLQKMEELVQEPLQERLARRTAQNLSLSYYPVPKEIDGKVFGQVINRAKATRRPWHNARSTLGTASVEQAFDRLVIAWRGCTRAERQLFLDSMHWLARRLHRSAKAGRAGTLDPRRASEADAGDSTTHLKMMAEVDLISQVPEGFSIEAKSTPTRSFR